MGESTILLFKWIVCFRSRGTIVVHHRRLRLNQFKNGFHKKVSIKKSTKGSSQTHLLLILRQPAWFWDIMWGSGLPRAKNRSSTTVPGAEFSARVEELSSNCKTPGQMACVMHQTIPNSSGSSFCW